MTDPDPLVRAEQWLQAVGLTYGQPTRLVLDLAQEVRDLRAQADRDTATITAQALALASLKVVQPAKASR